MVDQLILVNEKDETVGVGEKLKVHREGLLHRAFSIIIVNSQRDLLLQRRAHSKYHSSGLWSNTCCGHPRPGEELTTAAQQRLRVEMGLNCKLEEIGSIIYRANVSDDLVEHEFDHLLIGRSDFEPVLNPNEAIAWRWIDSGTLRGELSNHPEKFTCWLRIIINSELLNLRGFFDRGAPA